MATAPGLLTNEKGPVMEAGEGNSKRHVYTSHLKKVLKSYQEAATTSLHGPNSVMGVWTGSEPVTAVSPPDPACTVTSADKPFESSSKSKLNSAETSSSSSSSTVVNSSVEYDPFVAPPPFPIQQPPIFTPADQGRCEKSETVLQSAIISCFSVGGEERLCLPQILNSVLRDFSLPQIHSVCDNLHIFCSRCNSEQVEILKATSVLPLSAPSCGLITKTDAERLCAALLDSNPPKYIPNPDMKPLFHVKVYHECFGRCTGSYMPDLYTDSHARCIQCVECHGIFSPQKFVCHAHHQKEKRTCHWGFDSLNWRAYILLEEGLEKNPQLKDVLRDMKSRFDVNHKYKRKQDLLLNVCNWNACRMLAENCDSSSKRFRVDNFYPFPYAYDPALVYWYANPLWNKGTAFKSFSPVITKDGTYIPPEALPSIFKDRLEYSHNLALTPANVQKLGLMKIPEETVIAYHARKTESTSKRPTVKKDADCDSNSCCFDPEDAFSDTTFSTLSAGTEDGLMSNLDEDDELQPSKENEFLKLNKIMTDLDASLRTQILSEVESIIAKYRTKCLINAGKKPYHQMELEKVNSAQKAKIHKLQETNKHLEETLRKYQESTIVVTVPNEQSENTDSRMTLNLSSPQAKETKNIIVENPITNCENSIQTGEGECINIVTTCTSEEKETVLTSRRGDSPTLPKQSLNPEIEPLGK